jgi:diacylglycerol kinase (ATP)
MHKHLKHQAMSFSNALTGISWTFQTQPHFQFHILVGIIVIALGIFFEIGIYEFGLLFFTISMVLAFEMINTAIEALVDRSTSEWQGFAKIAKDVSAGAVLMVSLGAAAVGFFIFAPRLITMFNF